MGLFLCWLFPILGFGTKPSTYQKDTTLMRMPQNPKYHAGVHIPLEGLGYVHERRDIAGLMGQVQEKCGAGS